MKVILIALAALLVLTFLVLLILLLIPVRVVFDSRVRSGWIGWNKWLRASLRQVDEETISLHALFWRKRFNLTEEIEKAGSRSIKSRTKEKTDKKISADKKKANGFKRMPSFSKLISAIWISKLNIDLDTNDYILNAWLVPLFEAFSWHSGFHTRINFVGLNQLQMVLKVKLIRVVRAFI